MSGKRHIGSSFDGFLAEEGLLGQATMVAQKRVLAWQLARAMRERKITKAALARRMRTSRSALDRLLDPRNAGVTLASMGGARQAAFHRPHGCTAIAAPNRSRFLAEAAEEHLERKRA